MYLYSEENIAFGHSLGLKELNSFVLCLVKVKVKLEPHEEQIFVDDDDEVSVSYMYLRDIHRPCFIVFKVYFFYPEKKFKFGNVISSCTICLNGHTGQWWIQGRGPGSPRPPPPLIFGPN